MSYVQARRWYFCFSLNVVIVVVECKLFCSKSLSRHLWFMETTPLYWWLWRLANVFLPSLSGRETPVKRLASASPPGYEKRNLPAVPRGSVWMHLSAVLKTFISENIHSVCWSPSTGTSSETTSFCSQSNITNSTDRDGGCGEFCFGKVYFMETTNIYRYSI